MNNNQFESNVNGLAHIFVEAVLTAVGKMTPAQFSAMGVGGGPSRKFGKTMYSEPKVAPRANGKSAKKGQKKMEVTATGRLARRTPEQLAAIGDKIVKAVTKSGPTGMRAEQIRAALNLDVREISTVLPKIVAAKSLKTTGDKRGTTYFAPGKASAGKRSVKAASGKGGHKATAKASAKTRKAARKPAKKSGKK